MNKLGLLLFVFTTSLFASVVAYKNHPSYSTALTELQVAQSMLNQKVSDWQVTDDEKMAVKLIGETIAEIKKAEQDDGKEVNEHPTVLEINERKAQLAKVEEYLKKAHEDIKNDSDSNFGNGLKNKTLTNIDVAVAAVIRAKVECE